MHDWDDAYANGAHIPDGDDYPARWTDAAAQFRGKHPLTKIADGDLFLPQKAPHGLMVFIHGGYWMKTGPSVWSHLAEGALMAGWACLLPAYTLAPQARIFEMTIQVAEQITLAAGQTAGPVALTGHSAGGHLAARMICDDGTLDRSVTDRITACVPISPLSDLRSLMRTAMNDTLHLDLPEALSESPALLEPLQGIPVTTWVGGSERPEFIRHARLLADVWAGLGVATDCVIDPGLHHFNVIEALSRPDTPLMKRLLSYSALR
ncbi:alpha/beta hydrolase [Paracoccus sp. JM45]|nr:alpha/beta hydrolase [Paracoccus sp. JM45]